MNFYDLENSIFRSPERFNVFRSNILFIIDKYKDDPGFLALLGQAVLKKIQTKPAHEIYEILEEVFLDDYISREICSFPLE